MWPPAGPWVLDLGDVLYAPTVFTDGQGRLVMLAWMQELRAAAGRLYAGCLSVPRLLSLQGVHAARRRGLRLQLMPCPLQLLCLHRVPRQLMQSSKLAHASACIRFCFAAARALVCP